VKWEPRDDRPRKRRRRKDARPAEITAAALGIFADHGFAAAKLDDIARKAGVVKGSIYLYFCSARWFARRWSPIWRPSEARPKPSMVPWTSLCLVSVGSGGRAEPPHHHQGGAHGHRRVIGSSACSLKGLSDPTGRVRTTPGFDIVAATTSESSRHLVKKIALRAPVFQRHFHQWRRYRQIVDAQGRLKGLKFSGHRPPRRACRTLGSSTRRNRTKFRPFDSYQIAGC